MSGPGPAIASSAFVVALAPNRGDDLDAKQCMEIGAAILLDKPIVLVSDPGDDVPPGLVRIAHRHIRLREPWTTESGQAQLAAELAVVLGERGARR